MSKLMMSLLGGSIALVSAGVAGAAMSSGEYKVAREKCDAMSGGAKDRCIAEIKAKFGKS